MPDPQAHEHEHGPQEGKKVAYEMSDINFGAVIKFGAGLTAVGLVVHLIILGFNALLIQQAKESQPQLSPLLGQERSEFRTSVHSFPKPQLQVREEVDYQKLRSEQDAQLHSYGWVDEMNEIVHMPIDEAIKILADPKRQADHGIKGPKEK